ALYARWFAGSVYYVIGVELVLSLLFFFASRRRHTRSKRDWSSDVCSSDLMEGNYHKATRQDGETEPFVVSPGGVPTAFVFKTIRSEERRVGKERSAWWGR